MPETEAQAAWADFAEELGTPVVVPESLAGAESGGGVAVAAPVAAAPAAAAPVPAAAPEAAPEVATPEAGGAPEA